ncbi:MAG: DUF192 domain-containing protein [Rhodobacteraceae bacterium]|nr:DUF192 domain-containing protein [Paracoccaceae bacterium]
MPEAPPAASPLSSDAKAAPQKVVIPRNAPQSGLATASVTVESAGGGVHVFSAEVADTAATRNHGMMYRTKLAKDAGMLFVYDPPQPAAFWMRNTLIPLDIVFISPEGRIIRIAENARPRDETPLPSGGVIIAALEIQGGLSRRLGLAPGDIVRSIALSPFWARRHLDADAPAQ